ncbi:MAG: conjugal transfer pilus assembly protein TraD [Actinomycetota bacterium]|nr:conjugal transfer pilus assembly protein TraD [Actinomycetota bacterium]
MNPTSDRPAAPRTWFSRTPDSLRDPDREAFLAIGAAIVAVTAPLVIITAGVIYLAGRALRIRWWWPLAAGTLSGVATALVYSPAGLAGRYGAGYHHLWLEAHDAGIGGALRDGWATLLGALAPLSIPVALVAGGVALGYAQLRRPVWRTEPTMVGKAGRRRERERTRLATTADTLTDDGHFPIGVDTTSGEVVHLVEADLSAHAFVAGASRSGKTTALVAVARAVVAGWGRPLVYIDLKGDPDVTNRLRRVAEAAGTPFWGWSLEGGATWNPLAHGDPSLLKDKLVGLERFSEPHYQRAAERFLQLVFGALAARPEPMAPTLAEVVSLLDPKKLSAFARSLPAEVGDALWAYVDGLTKDQLSGVAGLATRLALLTESTAGPYLQPATNQLDLATVARSGGVVVFSLDSGRWPGLSAQVGALVVQDLKAVCGEALHGPRGPWYVMIDEFSALDGAQLLGLLARGAAAGCSVILATQELADLNAAGDGFRDQVLGNAALKAAFRQDVPDSAELWAAMAGTQPGWAETIQTAHRSAGPVATATGHATGTGSLRQVEQYRVHPNTIKTLPQGRCLLIRKHPGFSAQVLDVVVPETMQNTRAA